MRFGGRFLLSAFLLPTLTALGLRADPGDIENAHDYAGFPRLPGYLITDFDEDNPADFDFPVSRPVPVDADQIALVRVKGHRFVIRYELGANAHSPSLYQTQLYFEKRAIDAGYTVEKTGAVKDANETFRLVKGGAETWVYLVPGLTANVLTIVEADRRPVVPPLAQEATPSLGAKPTPAPLPPPSIASKPAVTPAPDDMASALTSPPGSPPEPAPTPLPEETAGPAGDDSDSLFASLTGAGRVVLPVGFLPGKPELDSDSQPEIDRVVAMMKQHPELSLRIEGHTDNSGSEEANLRLSAERALAVQAKLIEAHIDGRRIDAVGVGGLQPLADNQTARGREKNRRIELVEWKKFHASAPNGQNYYPPTNASTTQ